MYLFKASSALLWLMVPAFPTSSTSRDLKKDLPCFWASMALWRLPAADAAAVWLPHRMAVTAKAMPKVGKASPCSLGCCGRGCCQAPTAPRHHLCRPHRQDCRPHQGKQQGGLLQPAHTSAQACFFSLIQLGLFLGNILLLPDGAAHNRSTIRKTTKQKARTNRWKWLQASKRWQDQSIKQSSQQCINQSVRQSINSVIDKHSLHDPSK